MNAICRVQTSRSIQIGQRKKTTLNFDGLKSHSKQFELISKCMLRREVKRYDMQESLIACVLPEGNSG
jgi:hypothetical protein